VKEKEEEKEKEKYKENEQEKEEGEDREKEKEKEKKKKLTSSSLDPIPQRKIFSFLSSLSYLLLLLISFFVLLFLFGEREVWRVEMGKLEEVLRYPDS
jgi:hypothetical protein